MKRRTLLTILTGLVALLGSLFGTAGAASLAQTPPQDAPAVTYTVTTTNDAGSGSLRQALWRHLRVLALPGGAGA